MKRATIQEYVFYKNEIDEIKKRKIYSGVHAYKDFNYDTASMMEFFMEYLIDCDINWPDFVNLMDENVCVEERSLGRELIASIAEKKKDFERDNGMTCPKFIVIGRMEENLLQRTHFNSPNVEWIYEGPLDSPLIARIFGLDTYETSRLSLCEVRKLNSNWLNHYGLTKCGSVVK